MVIDGSDLYSARGGILGRVGNGVLSGPLRQFKHNSETLSPKL